VETSYWNKDICKFESSQKDEAQSPFGWFLENLPTWSL